ncbi:MAG: hypothetical protein OIF58_13915 [Cohaesibacter sp.]|nr:hypothetical protein [Cohaesibacter sp.]
MGDHNGRDQIRINDKATKLTLAISPSQKYFPVILHRTQKILNFQISEEKKLTSEQELCLWAADAGHNFIV